MVRPLCDTLLTDYGRSIGSGSRSRDNQICEAGMMYYRSQLVPPRNIIRLCLLFVFVFTQAGNTQDRMPAIPESEMTEEQLAAVDEYKQVRNTTRFGGPFVPLLRSPEVLSRARNLGDHARFNTVLPPRLSEFVILLTARQWTQHYEWGAHATIAEREGLHPNIISAVADGRHPADMSTDESAVYNFCMELFRTQGVSDPTYERMVAQFGEKGVIDTIGIMGYYQLLAMVMNTARTPLRDGMLPIPTFPR